MSEQSVNSQLVSKRLNEVETKLSFLQETIELLQRDLLYQQTQARLTKKALQLMYKRIEKTSQQEENYISSEGNRPPHY